MERKSSRKEIEFVVNILENEITYIENNLEAISNRIGKKTALDVIENRASIIKNIKKSMKEGSVYFSLSDIKALRVSIQTNLYKTGILEQYSKDDRKRLLDLDTVLEKTVKELERLSR